MNIPERAAGPAILALAFVVNALLNHTALGGFAGQLPGSYVIVFYVGVGLVLPALALGRTVRREPLAARPLGVVLGWRDVIALIAALAVGCALAAKPLAPILAQPDGPMRVLTLFSQLLVASTAEVSLFLGAMGLGLRAWLGGRHDWRYGVLLVVVSSLVFGLFYLTYPSPWNTLDTATTVGIVWLAVSILFVLTRSLVAAVLLNNIMATIGFATRGLTLPLSPAVSLLIELLAVAAFVAAFTWSRRTVRPASPSPAPR